ncbi:MAG: cbb3-type cytochrome oxidase assembly protein CcoS [Proteobacteria bacterium]|nr:cbb3-type cytochrome oxidase assembly protein CcoS [Pseudomonadota bacterium]
MEVLYVIVPLALGFAGFAVLAFVWSVKSGQYDDPAGAAHRVLQDEMPSITSADHEV